MNALTARVSIASAGAVEFYFLAHDVEGLIAIPEGLAPTQDLVERGLHVLDVTTGGVEIMLAPEGIGDSASPKTLADELLRRIDDVAPRLLHGVRRMSIVVEDLADGRPPIGDLSFRANV